MSRAPGVHHSLMASLNELRDINRRRILDSVRHAGPADRAELARRTGLSRATISALVADCVAGGVLVEEPADRAEGARGRTATRLRLDPLAAAVVGVDFGHRHLRVAVADLNAETHAERSADLDVDASADDALDRAATLVRAVLQAAGVEPARVLAVGMGVPGPVDPATETIRSAAILPGWHDVHPAAGLQRRLALPVRIENDANLGALGEYRHGAGRGHDDMLYLKLSSGVGAGLIFDGSLYTGASGIAGEVGHIAVEPWGPLCRCGNRGCLETLATTTAIARHVGPVDGADLPWPSLVALARDGDRTTLDAVRHAGTVVGQVLAGLCTAVDPGIVVVGGDLGGCRAFLDAARSTMRSGALRPQGLDLVPAVLGDRAELLGAIDIALDAPLERP